MKENKIGGIPIVDNNKVLVGILTNRDLRFENNKSRQVSEVMTKENLITAPQGTDLKKAEKILQNIRSKNYRRQQTGQAHRADHLP